ncbi:MAG: hypothetical protein ACFFHD_00985 [Promethearchaeota archaeon]
MIFQDGMGGIRSIVIALILILASILIFKLGLIATQAREKTNIRWVAASFGIQFGIVLFISLPLSMSSFEEGPPGIIIALVIIFSALVVTNVINVIHKIGLKRSFVVMILIIVPISFAMAIIFSGGSVLQ